VAEFGTRGVLKHDADDPTFAARIGRAMAVGMAIGRAIAMGNCDATVEI
jgi:hypothetical protein